jgi:hypothetical protein
MFIFKDKIESDIISVDINNFFSILSEEEDSVNISIRYKIRATDVVQKNLNRVKIEILESSPPPTRFFETPNDTQKTIRDFLTFNARAIRDAQKRKDLVLGTVMSDITKFLKKDILEGIKLGKKVDEIESAKITKVRVRRLREEADPTWRTLPQGQKREESTIDQKALFKRRSYDLLLREKIDPSKIWSQISDSTKFGLKQSIIESKKSERLSLRAIEGSKSLKLSVKNRSDYSVFTEKSVQEWVEISAPISIKKTLGALVVSFEAFSIDSDIFVDKREVILSLDSSLSAFRSSLRPPNIQFQRIGADSFFFITQTDKRAKNVSVFSKNAKSSPDINKLSYQKFGDFSVSAGEKLKIKVPTSIENTMVWRFIPGDGLSLSPVFSSYVVSPIKKERGDDVIVFAKKYLEKNKIEVGALNIPEDARTIQFFSKNITRRERSSSAISPVFQISGLKGDARTFSEKISAPKSDHKVEITCKLTYKTGISSIKGPCYFSNYIGKGEESETTAIKSSRVEDGDILIEIDTKRKEKGLDLAKEALRSREDLSFFSGEVEESKRALSNLVAFKVDRINTRTGVKEGLGVTVDTIISDAALSSVAGVPPADPNGDYSYEISVLSAPPETVLKKENYERTDKETSKIWRDNPPKFKNRSAIQFGTIPRDTTLNFERSYTGIVHEVSVQGRSRGGSIKNLRVERIQSDFIKVQFDIEGNLDVFDHFVLKKIVNGDEVFVESIHSQGGGSPLFFYRLNSTDLGSIIFSVTSVKNDYTIESEILSNELIIEE